MVERGQGPPRGGESRERVGVSEVVRRHGLSPKQLFGWRREAQALLHEAGNAPQSRRRGGGQSVTPGIWNDAPPFAPVVITGLARRLPYGVVPDERGPWYTSIPTNASL
ncbi:MULTISPECIES: transposase [Bradyrhizobium]|uniref:transposase n=1 Tax=Bradyrhizobium TaxID=374 RepID=UPI0009EB0C61|nr:transposase [Bradyrhizobium retamae]